MSMVLGDACEVPPKFLEHKVFSRNDTNTDVI